MKRSKRAVMIWRIGILTADIYTIDNLESLVEHEGYLYCVSNSNDSFSELIDEECKLRDQGILCVHAGSYNNGGGIGVQYEVSESKI